VRLIAEFKGERREHRFGRGSIVIGRDPCCDIVFSDPKLSRLHLQCSFEGGRITVRDLGTKNGTFVGSQRIEEARLPPGVPLRAGDVRLRFETEEGEESPVASASVPSPGRERGATTPPGAAGDLESRVPAAENYEQDEEPTPSVDQQALAPAPAAEEARVVVRDNRWYLRDPETGLEVEIVPVQKGRAAAEAGAPPGAQLPARIIRRDERLAAPPAPVRAAGPGRFSTLMGDPKRRVRVLLAALAGLIVLVVAAAVLLRPPKRIPPLTRAQYRALIDRSVELFQTDPAAAAEQLRELQQRPAQGEPRLARILQEAFEADSDAAKNLEKGHETAEAKWEEVRKSSESTEAAVALARERYDWFQSRVIDLNYLGAARDAVKRGEYLKALDNAAGIDKAGRYAKEAETLTQQATDAIMKIVADDAGQMRWTAAVQQLNDLIKERPELAESLQPKVAEYEQNEAQRKNIEEAQQLIQNGNLSDAGQLLEKIGGASPYAKQAEALLTEIHTSELRRNAQNAYDRGSGEQAVEMLTKAGLGEWQTTVRMRAVIKAKARADEALKAGRFAEAVAAWDEILRLEPSQNNFYRQEAQRNSSEENIHEAKTAFAHKLADQAALANHDKKYQAARDGFEEALKLDPTNKKARDGLAVMSKEALLDFNVIIALPRDTLEQVNEVLRKLQSVRDRILTDDPLYAELEREIAEVQRIKAKLENAGGQKAP
jgi:hypothetical protein